MRPGLLSFPNERVRRFETEAQVIDTTNGNSFPHYFGRVPALVSVYLVCITANNNYKVDDIIPLENIWLDNGAANSGANMILKRYTAQTIFIRLGTSTPTLRFFDPTLIVTNANAVVFTITQWKVKCICLDAYPIA
jgi:hypothetical protein